MLGGASLIHEYGFHYLHKLRGRAVEQNANAVDPCRQNADTDDRADQNCDRDRDLVPCDRAHSNAREHSHWRGERHVGTDLHGEIIDRAARHREHNDHKADDKEEGDRHHGGIDVLQL